MSMILLPVQHIARHAHPLRDPPWPDLRVCVDEQLIRQAYCDLISGRADPNAFSRPLSDRQYLDGRHHAGRVAWLAMNGWPDTISIDATDITRGLWPVSDGNHRLAAALLRGDTHIEAEIGGFESDVIAHFGPAVASQVFDRVDEPELCCSPR